MVQSLTSGKSKFLSLGLEKNNIFHNIPCD